MNLIARLTALKSSVVLDVNTEEGRLFHIGIGSRKKNSYEHHFRPCISCTVNHELPWYVLSWLLGSDFYLSQGKLVKTVKEEFALNPGLQGKAT